MGHVAHRTWSTDTVASSMIGVVWTASTRGRCRVCGIEPDSGRELHSFVSDVGGGGTHTHGGREDGACREGPHEVELRPMRGEDAGQRSECTCAASRRGKQDDEK